MTIDHSKTLAIYHDADLDGITCREIARRALPGATLLGYDYGRPVPDLTPYETVYLMDISLPTDVMIANRRRLVWLDHHISKMRDLDGVHVPGCRIDGVAACRITWQWFNGQRTASKETYLARRVMEPYAVQLLGEYDIWDKRSPDTDLFQLGMQAEASPDWDLLLDVAPDTIARIIEAGRAIQAYSTVTNAQIATERGFDVAWEGLSFRALNTARSNSLVFTAALKPHHDGCLSYFWDGGKWRFSLYGVPGKPDVDLSVIAKRHNGGGHAQACGGFWTRLPAELGGFSFKDSDFAGRP